MYRVNPSHTSFAAGRWGADRADAKPGPASSRGTNRARLVSSQRLCGGADDIAGDDGVALGSSAFCCSGWHGPTAIARLVGAPSGTARMLGGTRPLIVDQDR
jgi:hypothetical protein